MKKIVRIMADITILLVIVILVASISIKNASQNENNQKVEILEEAIDKHQVSEEVKEDVKDVIDTFKKEEYVLSDNSIGILEIPKLKYKSSIGEGTNFEKMDQSVGHIKDTALPGQTGNVLLEGSTNIKYRQSIPELQLLEKDDSVKVRTLNGEFNYRVLNKRVVKNKEIETYKENNSKSILTILLKSSSEEFLVIQAKLV
ncbi:sortase [Bacillus thuringiensis]|uniref:sortase n=1 Tax=Bacillus thuringiensis TaxID=1428 RepID=UPI0011A959FA|nr:sortase [Bacillus thuringiensis]